MTVDTQAATARRRVWRHLGLVGAGLVACAVVATDLGRLGVPKSLGPLEHLALAAAWLVVGGALVAAGRRQLVGRRDDVHDANERRAWNLFATVFTTLGYLYVLLGILGLLHVNLGNILVGGAVTGIVLGIAAQSALGNMFGGMLVLLLHPYAVGQRIMVRSSSFGGVEYAGTVREVTLFYSVLDSAAGRLVIPNAIAVASVVRIEPIEADQGASLPIPYRVSLDEVRTALREAGLPDGVRVDALAADAYTVHVQVPPGSPVGALVDVMRRLAGPPAP